MKQRPWHVWLIILAVGFIYAMGIYDFFMMLSHNEHYYASHNYGQAVVKYFTAYPLWERVSLYLIFLSCS